MKDVRRILVIGSGIGGATAALALSRLGFEVDCIDTKPDIPATGSGICLLHNTMRAMEMLGLAQACHGSGFPFEVFRQFDAHGRPVAVNPAPPACGIRRPDLARILEGAAARAGARMRKGVSFKQLVDRGREVEVTFSHGSEASYDLVVGADGVYSSIRDQVFGPAYVPRYAGQSVWRFNAARPAEVDGMCLYRSADVPNGVGALPTSREICYLFFLENCQDRTRMPQDHLDVLLREKLAAFSAPTIRDALAQLTSPDQVVFRPLHITLVPAPWHRGRVVLVGDAAHAPTPQMTSGGGLAIEDAVVLAESMRDSVDATEALSAYSRRRFARVKTVFDASLQLCLWAQEPVPNPQRVAQLLTQTYQYLGQPV
jgi:2-polyprenyl-6-methoxyphenol hydroxylase-like FAD-dependent oxidoreductase